MGSGWWYTNKWEYTHIKTTQRVLCKKVYDVYLIGITECIFPDYNTLMNTSLFWSIFHNICMSSSYLNIFFSTQTWQVICYCMVEDLFCTHHYLCITEETFLQYFVVMLKLSLEEIFPRSIDQFSGPRTNAFFCKTTSG